MADTTAFAELKRLGDEVTAAKERLAAAWRKSARIAAVKDYEFASKAGPVRLSSLFGTKPDLIVIHNMGRKCPYCTLWADGLNGLAGHLANRAGFVLSNPDDVPVQAEFAASRGWAFPVVSTKGTTFAADMGFEQNGDPWPGYSVFRRGADGTITRTGAGMFGPGDDYCAIWPMMEQMEGGVNGWEPKYKY